MRTLRDCAAVAAVAFLLALAGCRAETGSTSMVATPAGAAFLPAVSAGGCPTCPPCAPTETPTATPTPAPIMVEIYDCAGEISTTWWLTSTFGEVSWSAGSLAELRCSIGPSVLVAHVEDGRGEPVENATVVLWWPDAPWLPAELQQCNLERGAYGPTNANGDIGFGLGPGSYYSPPAAGIHVMWVVGGESCLAGLGMLAGTEHQHLDSGWVVSGKAADADRGYSTGAVVYEETVGGRRMWVILVR